MKNIVFFSFKGGVGRTLVLLDTAFIIARTLGRNVGIIDGDIEAPSLHFILDIQPERDQNFVDILLGGVFGKTAIAAGSIPIKSVLPEKRREKIGSGNVVLYPSLFDDPREPKIDRIKYDDNTRDTLRDFLEKFTTVNKLDYILVDCRPGVFTGMARLTLSLASCICLVFRLDRQNVDGVRYMLVQAAKRKRPIFLIANQVPKTERGMQRIAEFQELINKNIDVIIPFDERLIFGDVIAALDFEVEDAFCNSYEKLIKILEGKV